MLRFDHIAISAADLAHGVATVETALGVGLAPGGRHAAMGTYNRLFGLGPAEYAEVIAIDPEAPAPDQPRWFDLDRFHGPPRMTNWICACDDLEAALARAPAGAGRIWELARGDLRWRMAVPEDGRLPFGGRFPALIEWQGAAHPAQALPERGMRLQRLRLAGPDAEGLRAALTPLMSDLRLEFVEASEVSLSARIAVGSRELVL